MTITSPLVSAARELITLAHTQGGGTVSLGTGTSITPSKGYAVGGSFKGLTFEVSNPDPEFLILGWIAEAPSTLTFVGSWLHEGTIYIDAVDVVESFSDAVRLGKERGEIAIFDFAILDEIVIGDYV